MAAMFVLELSETEKRGIGGLKPTLWNHNAKIVGAFSTSGLLRHTEADNGQEVYSDRMGFATTVKAQSVGVVRFIVAIKVDRGYCIVIVTTNGNIFSIIIVVIAYQHHGIVIDRVAGVGAQCRYSIGHRSVNRLVLTIDIIIVAVRIALSATNISNTVSSCHCRIIYHIRIGIRKIGSLGPVRLDSNSCHTFGHIPVGTLVEDATTDRVEILIGAIAVGKVVGSGSNLTISINCCISSRSERTRGTVCDADNLPTCYHTTRTAIICRCFSIIVCTHFIIVGQLHLSVIEVEMVRVFIGDDEGGVTVCDGSANRSSELSTATTHLNGDGQLA